jgi:hypothetical protein
MGWGTSTCAQFANLYRSDPEFVEEHLFIWAQGFMSGLNVALQGDTGLTKNLGSMSTAQQQGAIRAYCNDHPLATYIDAVLDLWSGFSPNKPVRKPN